MTFSIDLPEWSWETYFWISIVLLHLIFWNVFYVLDIEKKCYGECPEGEEKYPPVLITFPLYPICCFFYLLLSLFFFLLFYGSLYTLMLPGVIIKSFMEKDKA